MNNANFSQNDPNDNEKVTNPKNPAPAPTIPQDVQNQVDELNKDMDQIVSKPQPAATDSQAPDNPTNDEAATARAAKLRSIAENLNQNPAPEPAAEASPTPVPQAAEVSENLPDNSTLPQTPADDKVVANKPIDAKVVEALNTLIADPSVNPELKEQLKIELLKANTGGNEPVAPAETSAPNPTPAPAATPTSPPLNDIGGQEVATDTVAPTNLTADSSGLKSEEAETAAIQSQPPEEPK